MARSRGAERTHPERPVEAAVAEEIDDSVADPLGGSVFSDAFSGAFFGAFLPCRFSVPFFFRTLLFRVDRMAASPDPPLVARIRQGDAGAWEDLIDRYEGRLRAFAESRVGSRAAAEDIVQECFIGFLTSLPHFDGRRPLESYLFSICAYKLTDHLRREGRRPTLRLDRSRQGGEEGSSPWDVAGPARPASSLARSVERKRLEEQAVRDAIAEQIARWKERGDWTKLRCLEWLFVRGKSNKEVAAGMRISEQQVANFKSDFQIRLRSMIRRQALDEAVFPELAE
jgi:RNA polymerase sigma-70 factor (ECF subfamily)